MDRHNSCLGDKMNYSIVDYETYWRSEGRLGNLDVFIQLFNEVSETYRAVLFPPSADVHPKNKELADLTKEYNERYGNKQDDELSDTDKRMMRIMEQDIESVQKDIEGLVAKQKSTLGKFNKLINEAKRRIGVR